MEGPRVVEAQSASANAASHTIVKLTIHTYIPTWICLQIDLAR